MEILEVPALMDTCFRSGSYDDVLDLRAFVSKLALLHPDLPVSRLSTTWKPANPVLECSIHHNHHMHGADFWPAHHWMCELDMRAMRTLEAHECMFVLVILQLH